MNIQGMEGHALIPIERVVGQQKFHNSFPGFLDQRCVGIYLKNPVKAEIMIRKKDTLIPGMTGMAQEATGLALFSTSTKHIRQLPAMESCS